MVWLLLALGALLLFAVVVGGVVFLAAKNRPRKPVAVDAFGDPIAEAPPRAVPAPPVAAPAPVEVPAPPRAEPAPSHAEPAPPVATPPAPTPTVAAPEPAAEPPRRPAIPEGAFAPRPTLVADPDFEPYDEAPPPLPTEAPPPLPTEAPPPPAPAIAPPVETAAPPAPTPATLDQIEKLRIADLDLIVRASALHLHGTEYLAFTTEGFVARGRKELALYVDRAAVADADVVRSLKRFAGLSLHAIERPAPVAAGELLKLPGEVGGVPLAGYLAVDANEPAPVALGDHVVLLGLAKADVAGDAAAVRNALVARHGALPWVTPLRRDA